MNGVNVDEVARARLALVSAGQRLLSAPRRAVGDSEEPSGEEPSGSAVERVDLLEPATSRAVSSSFRLTKNHVIVVGALLLCAVAIAVIAITRSSATPVPLVAQVSPAVESPALPSASPVMLRVHVAGAVERPGVVSVVQGSIVQDAIAAAGGFTAEADAAELNLAAPLTDGMQIIIGTTSAPQGDILGGDGAAARDESAPLDLNTATAAQLEELPGIGPVSAQAIVAWREENGRFTEVAQLQEVSGIGPKIFAKLEPLVTV